MRYTAHQPTLARDTMVALLRNQGWETDAIAEMSDEDMRAELLPGLEGALRAYRIYDHSHCTFDTFPQPEDGGPAMAVMPEWGVSYTLRAGRPELGVKLNAYRVPYEGVHHELDGNTYPTQAEARRAAFDAGLLGFMVYEPADGE